MSSMFCALEFVSALHYAALEFALHKLLQINSVGLLKVPQS